MTSTKIHKRHPCMFRAIHVTTPRSIARRQFRGRHGWRSGPGYTKSRLTPEAIERRRARAKAGRRQR